MRGRGVAGGQLLAGPGACREAVGFPPGSRTCHQRIIIISREEGVTPPSRHASWGEGKHMKTRLMAAGRSLPWRRPWPRAAAAPAAYHTATCPAAATSSAPLAPACSSAALVMQQSAPIVLHSAGRHRVEHRADGRAARYHGPNRHGHPDGVATSRMGRQALMTRRSSMASSRSC